jgi:voltage-gated potassium channel Kch
VRQNFPDVTILARARNRRHAHLLMDAGVSRLVRETYHSALFLAEEMLIGLGHERNEAHELITLFQDTDERSLQRQHGLHHDQERIVQSSREAAAELQTLFSEDQRERGNNKAGNKK